MERNIVSQEVINKINVSFLSDKEKNIAYDFAQTLMIIKTSVKFPDNFTRIFLGVLLVVFFLCVSNGKKAAADFVFSAVIHYPFLFFVIYKLCLARINNSRAYLNRKVQKKENKNILEKVISFDKEFGYLITIN